MSKPKRIVVDSSVIVKWLSSQDEKFIPQANKILQDAKEEKIEIYTTELANYEVGNTLFILLQKPKYRQNKPTKRDIRVLLPTTTLHLLLWQNNTTQRL